MHEMATQSGGPHRLDIRQIGMALHDLCQPLTTLQCRLELAGMIDTPEAYKEAVEAGLLECARIADEVASMRDMMRCATPEEEESGV